MQQHLFQNVQHLIYKGKTYHGGVVTQFWRYSTKFLWIAFQNQEIGFSISIRLARLTPYHNPLFHGIFYQLGSVVESEFSQNVISVGFYGAVAHT